MLWSSVSPTRAILCACLVSAAASVALGQSAPPPPGPAPVVNAAPHGAQDVIFGPGNDQAARPALPPLDQIPPVTMPPRVSGVGATGAVMVHDAQTGATFEVPEAPRGADSGAGTGYIGVDGVEEFPELARNFGTMYATAGLNSFPRSPNCRLYMRWVNHSGDSVYAVASGTMLDGGVVLTAAHCVFNRDASVNDWAREVWVYPGWDGADAPAGTDTFQYWGYTRGTYFIAGSGYVNSGNTDYDMGAIGIARGTNRSVGMLTGWFGWAWGYDCATIQGRGYNNFSYPAQGCGTPGLHDGRTMYYWSGTFDECPGNNLQLNTTPGCFTAVWGGMSGSSAYYLSGSSRYAHAVCSTSDRAYGGWYCKMWEGFATTMDGTFKANVRGTTFDLEAFRYRLTGSTTIQATTATSPAQVVFSNTTNADPASDTYTLRVYLSTNDTISSADTLLGTFTYTYDYAPMQNITVNIPAVTIPSVSTGTYWLGAVLDPGTDSYSSNNDTTAWDAQKITVTSAPPPVPGNNACASAYVYAAGAAVDGTTSFATTDGAATCGNSGASPDVWYRMTPALSGTLRIFMCDSLYDTVLSVHSACPGTAANQLACNDDSYSGGNGACGTSDDMRKSGLDLPVTAGATYYLRVSGYNGAGGNFTLDSYFLPPNNDDCSAAITYTLGSTATGSLAGSTNDGQADCGSSGTAGDAWFVMTPTQSGYIRLDTCGSSFDTVISVHTACPGTTDNVIACNDDATVGSCPGTWQSAVDVGVDAGDTYYIRIAGYSGSVGSYNLHSQFIAPPNDACANAIAITPGMRMAGVTTASTNDGSATCGASTTSPDVWYSMAVMCNGQIRVDTCGSTLDTVLSIHTGCPGITRNQIGCSDDVPIFTCLNTNSSMLTFNGVAGTTYLIRVAGYQGATGAFKLNTRYLTTGNNSCETASTVHDGSYTFTNCAATTDGPEETGCFGTGDPRVNNDLWFRYTSPVNGVATVSTCNSAAPAFDTKLAVYPGGCPGGAAGTAIACSDDACGALSSATFPCAFGETYLIRVGGYQTYRGTGLLSIGALGCGSADFDCDGDTATDADIEAFFACIAGSCPSAPCQSNADFNNDGDVATDADIEAFFRVLAGNPC